MSDIRSSLLGNRRMDTFQKMLLECQDRVNKIKVKNDTLQRHTGTDLEDEIAIQVQKQKQFIEQQIQELKELIDKTEAKYKDNEARNKLKILKKDAHREINRNKTILKDFVNKSFLLLKQLRQSQATGGTQDQTKYFVGGECNIKVPNLQDISGQEGISATENKYSNVEPSQLHVGVDPNFSINYQLEMQLQQQKNQMLQNIDHNVIRIFNIIGEQGLIIDKTGQDLDEIQNNLWETEGNIGMTNEKMNQANELQKAMRRKYICYAGIIVIAVVIIVGIILIVKLT